MVCVKLCVWRKLCTVHGLFGECTCDAMWCLCRPVCSKCVYLFVQLTPPVSLSDSSENKVLHAFRNRAKVSVNLLTSSELTFTMPSISIP